MRKNCLNFMGVAVLLLLASCENDELCNNTVDLVKNTSTESEIINS